MVIVDTDDAKAKATRLLTRWRDRKEGARTRMPCVSLSGQRSDGDDPIQTAGVNPALSTMVLVVTIATANLGEGEHGARVYLPPLRFYASASAMDDGAVKDEDGDEDNALCTLSGSRKRAPYLARQRSHGISVATYVTGQPLAGSAGGRRVAQRADQRTTARQRAHKQFTQVRAATRRKTLLLLWWIDGGMSVVMHSTLARQGLPQGCGDYARMVAWVHQLSNLLTPPTSAMGLLL